MLEVTINLATEGVILNQIRYFHWESQVGKRGMILTMFLIFIEKVEEILLSGVSFNMMGSICNSFFWSKSNVL